MFEPRSRTELFDVIATHVETGSIKVIRADKGWARADAFLERALIKGRPDSVVYAVVPAGTVPAQGKFSVALLLGDSELIHYPDDQRTRRKRP